MTRVNAPPMDMGMDDGLQIDVAIIGAGVSGVYTGWRLLDGEYKDGTPRLNKVHIFEMSDRIGGRLESVFLPGISIAAEIGGMRYLTSQKIVTTLIEDIFASSLKAVGFPLGDASTHYCYMRTQRFHSDAWTQAQNQGQEFKTHYYLRDDLVGYDSDQLFNKVIYDMLVADPWFRENHGSKVKNPEKYQYTFELTAQNWDNIKPNLTYNFEGPYQGMKVNDMGFWNLIKDQVGEEAYEFLSVAGGYLVLHPQGGPARQPGAVPRPRRGKDRRGGLLRHPVERLHVVPEQRRVEAHLREQRQLHHGGPAPDRRRLYAVEPPRALRGRYRCDGKRPREVQVGSARSGSSKWVKHTRR